MSEKERIIYFIFLFPISYGLVAIALMYYWIMRDEGQDAIYLFQKECHTNAEERRGTITSHRSDR